MIGPAGFMQAPLAQRGLRPVAELAQGLPCGNRLRYLAGCHCAECRRANTAYETARAAARKAGDWNGIVLAAKARAHLAALSEKSVGRRTVADVCGVSNTVLVAIISGSKTRIRARTERAILAVTEAAAADHALIPATDTWRYLDGLIADGYSKAELARKLGYATPALQIGRHQVTVRTAYDVQRLYLRLCMVSAAPSLLCLNALTDEGYTRRQILDRLAALAAEAGDPPPDLTVRRRRIRADAERVLLRLYEQLTE